MRQPNYYCKILTAFHKLKEICPSCSMGRHLSTILDDCGDVWNVTDKELSLIVSKYAKQLTLDKPHNEQDINRIIDEGLHLNKILLEESYNDGDDEF